VSDENTQTQTPASTESAEPSVDLSQYVPKKAHEDIKADLFKYKEQLKSLQEQISGQQANSLKEKSEWKQLAELREQELNQVKSQINESEERYGKLKSAIIEDKKLSAVRQFAAREGIEDNALPMIEMLELQGVIVETTNTGKVNVVGAEQFVQKLKAEKPFLFKKPGGAKINPGDPGVAASAQTTPAEISKAFEEGKRSRDYSKYNDLMKKYQAQRRG